MFKRHAKRASKLFLTPYFLHGALALFIVLNLTVLYSFDFVKDTTIVYKSFAATFTDDTQAEFDAGTYSDTQWDAGNSWVEFTPDGLNNSMDSSWTPQWASLLHYYEMDNDWTDSKGSNNGTAHGSATFSTTRQIGTHAGIFDGIDGGESCTTLDGSVSVTDLSVSAWVYATDTATYRTVIGSGDQSIARESILIQIRNTDVWKAYIQDSDGDVVAATSTIDAVEDVWTHLFTTFNASTGLITLYVNGVEVATGTNAAVSGPLTTDWRIGCHKNGAGPGLYESEYPGNIDDVAIWSTPLSAAEVTEVYERQYLDYSGRFTSDIKDVGGDADWNSLAWSPQQPHYKEYPAPHPSSQVYS